MRYIYLLLLVFVFTSCAKEFRNPYDSATPPDVWMPKAFKLDTLGTNALRLTWQQDELHIDGFAIHKTTNGQMKVILLPLDSLRYTDTQAVDTSSDAVCPELSYKVMARAGNNRSLEIGTASGIRMPLSTPANAGTDILVTDTSTTVQLNAQAPNAGERGQWTIISGSGGSFSNQNAHNSTFTGAPCTDYLLRWTKTGCTETFDEVNVKFQKAITIANAGANQIFTDATIQATLNANNSGAGESGVWTIISGSGGILENQSSPNTLFTGQSCTNYTLRWTITDVCNSSVDEMNVSFQKITNSPNAGANQTITSNGTQVTLAANTPSAGEIGTWTIINGSGGSFSNLNSPTSNFSGISCTNYTLRWTIQGICSSDFDDVAISFSQTNTIANAGPDQTITSNAAQVTLAANTPAAGETGTWTIISGVGGSLSNVNSPTSIFTGNACNSYTLRWTIGACSANYDDVVISFQQSVSQANAGIDQSFTNSTTQTNLSGNAVLTGEVGQWTVVSGTGGIFANATSPTTQFTGQGCQSYTLKWTKTSCSGSTFDNVVVTFNQAVTTANAGVNQTISSLSTTLSANSPPIGETGQWSIVSGSGGVFSNVNLSSSTFSGNPGVTYSLKWTITGICNASFDLVTIVMPGLPVLTTNTVSSITEGSAVCGGVITSSGGTTISERGVCWSTAPMPTVSLSTKTIDGSGTGSFTSQITNLNSNTTYYVRSYAINAWGTSYGNQNTFVTNSLTVGMNYGGGIIAYIYQPSDPGYSPSVQHGIIVTPNDLSTGVNWNNGSSIFTNAVGTGIGDGLINTNLIVSSQGAGNYAASICYNANTNGFSDWYLPSKDELNKLYVSRNLIGGFAFSHYWSSSEETFSNVYAKIQWLGDTFDQGYDYKNVPYRVRAIRYF
jgi:hypothetical protein